MQMKIRKSFIILFSAIIAVLLFACAFIFTHKTTVHAAEGGHSTDLYWGINSGVLTLSSQYDEDVTPNNYTDSTWRTSPDYDLTDIIEVTVDTYACAPKSMLNWFKDCKNLTTVDLTGLDTSRTTNMSYLFNNCFSLITLDVSTLDTSSVTNMNWMFGNCQNLSNLDVTNFNTSNVTNMGRMFFNCMVLPSLDVSTLDTSNVTDMNYMLSGLRGLTTLDVSGLDTSSATNMSHMFDWCNSLTTLDVSNFNTSSVTNMSYMFEGCTSVTSFNVSNIDTSNVTNMTHMFNNCWALTALDLSDFNTSSVTDASGMFSGSTCVLNEIHTPKIIGTVALPLPDEDNWWDSTKGAMIETSLITNDNAGSTIKRHASHSYGEWINEVPSNCTDTGKVAHKDCTICEHHFDSENEEIIDVTIAALGHTEKTVSALAPSCTESGLTAGKRCPVCETVLEGLETVAALGHNYGEWTVVKQATETEEGEERRVCVNDETHFETRTLPKLTPATPAPETPTAPAEQNKSYVWICWLLIPSAIAAGGITLGILVFKKKM